jgi:hypothetical protein
MKGSFAVIRDLVGAIRESILPRFSKTSEIASIQAGVIILFSTLDCRQCARRYRGTRDERGMISLAAFISPFFKFMRSSK